MAPSRTGFYNGQAAQEAGHQNQGGDSGHPEEEEGAGQVQQVHHYTQYLEDRLGGQQLHQPGPGGEGHRDLAHHVQVNDVCRGGLPTGPVEGWQTPQCVWCLAHPGKR